jgi:CHASE3 domain sensor protein
LVRGAVVLPLLVTVGLSALLLWDVGVLHARSGWVEHSRQVIGQVNLAQRLLIDEETGVRAYILSGDVAFLEPFAGGRAALPTALDTLAALVSDNPAQQARVETFRHGYRDWAQAIDAALAHAQAEQSWTRPADAGLRRDMLQRKAEMDGLRQITGAMVTAEEQLLAERADKAAWTIRATEWAGVVVAVIFGTLMTVASILRLASLDRFYRLALRRREESEESERRSRHAAEALAAEIAEQSREMERRFIAMRDERDRAVQRPTSPGRG